MKNLGERKSYFKCLFSWFHILYLYSDAIGKQSKSVNEILTHSPAIQHFSPLPSLHVNSFPNSIVSSKCQAFNRHAIIYISGYLVQKWFSVVKCSNCHKFLCDAQLSNTFLMHKQYSHTLTGLLKPSATLIQFCSALEKIFLHHWDDIFNRRGIIAHYLTVSSEVHFPTASCHPNMREFFSRNFLRLRLHHKCRLMTLAVKSQSKKVSAYHHNLFRKKSVSKAGKQIHLQSSIKHGHIDTEFPKPTIQTDKKRNAHCIVCGILWMNTLSNFKFCHLCKLYACANCFHANSCANCI